ncbi:MAG: GyrI-like domain-containing protein [Bacteroidota bacterium]|nr:GyrI-like domain-containing protein [Bacteroidota bacterium]
MEKIDFKKELKGLYAPGSKVVTIVDVPAFNFLMIDGKGNPNTSIEYRQAIETLYAVSYSAKFKIKKSKAAIDYSVMPLEGLWWVENETIFNLNNKDAWNWTAMILQPHFVNSELISESIENVKDKKGLNNLDKINFASFEEGLAVQIMHIGPYSEEEPNIKRMHSFIEENGFCVSGKHHEIYLKDPRKSAPEKLQTILRQPIKKK